MLINDSTTVAVEVPIFLLEDDIAALEETLRCHHHSQGTGPPRPSGAWSQATIHHGPHRFSSGAQWRDPYFSTTSQTRAPTSPSRNLSIYSLALTRLVPGLTLADMRCAWFNDTCYNEFAPGRLLQSRSEKRLGARSSAIVLIIFVLDAPNYFARMIGL